MRRMRHFVVTWMAAISMFWVCNDSALAASSDLDWTRHDGPTPSTVQPTNGNNRFSELTANGVRSDNTKRAVFQVSSYRAVHEEQQTLESFFSEVSEAKSLVLILAGLGIVGMIARRRIV